MSAVIRPSSRNYNELREIHIKRNFTKHAEGSVLISFGETQVICTASVSNIVPKFLKGKGSGWVTAEYGMLPRATESRTSREAISGKQSGRSSEIQRLIGRSLRQAVNLKALGENCITIDCDVIQADGGTRTAAITGGCIALFDAIETMRARKMISGNPFKGFIAAISVGVYKNTPVLDLDYIEDSRAETDMNVIMDQNQNFIEIQGTAEGNAFSEKELISMLELAKVGNKQLIERQKIAVGI